MRAIEIGRRMAELGHPEEACGAFALSLTKERGQSSPAERMEASVFLFQNGGDYQTAYDGFLDLYREGTFRREILPILTEAFYEPNVKDLRRRYEKNVRLLQRYPYLFRKDLPAFEDLPVRPYPFDDDTWVPFDRRTGDFGEKWRPRYEVIGRNFFKDLTDPILAEDVWSQYELEYLVDNVRRSEDIGRENHIYLHYTDWERFCSALQVLDLRPLLDPKKIVFLIGDEISQYPIDFRERFGIDYSQYPLRPVGIREVTRLIWHTQLSGHNGGDFFNEIFDFHPNLLYCTSIFLTMVEEEVSALREALQIVRSLRDLQEEILDHWHDPRLVEELYHLKDPTDKDLMVAHYMSLKSWSPNRDPASRIAPALFFQPHFSLVSFGMTVDWQGDTALKSSVMQAIQESSLFQGFKYIKTFTPMRRFTNSCGGTVRFYRDTAVEFAEDAKKGLFDKFDETLYKKNGPPEIDLSRYEGWEERTPEERMEIVRKDPVRPCIMDPVGLWTLSRGFMVDPTDRLFRDSVIVRFEDGKLQPRATFTRLAAFLDLPYTDTMTYCSLKGKRDPVSKLAGTSAGFDTRSIFTVQEGYMDDGARKFVEYLMRDAYKEYGYDTQWWRGEPVDLDTMGEWIQAPGAVRDRLRETQAAMDEVYRQKIGFDPLSEEQWEELEEALVERAVSVRRRAALGLMEDLRFVSLEGVPLVYGRLLHPDPELLDGPLYR